MKVKQLIEKLQTLDPELLVLVDGYEDGYHSPEDIRKISVHGPYEGKPYWDGEYELNNPKYNRKNPMPDLEAVYLPRSG
jgi:hypothetical protein